MGAAGAVPAPAREDVRSLPAAAAAAAADTLAAAARRSRQRSGVTVRLTSSSAAGSGRSWRSADETLRRALPAGGQRQGYSDVFIWESSSPSKLDQEVDQI